MPKFVKERAEKAEETNVSAEVEAQSSEEKKEITDDEVARRIIDRLEKDSKTLESQAGDSKEIKKILASLAKKVDGIGNLQADLIKMACEYSTSQTELVNRLDDVAASVAELTKKSDTAVEPVADNLDEKLVVFKCEILDAMKKLFDEEFSSRNATKVVIPVDEDSSSDKVSVVELSPERAKRMEELLDEIAVRKQEGEQLIKDQLADDEAKEEREKLLDGLKYRLFYYPS